MEYTLVEALDSEALDHLVTARLEQGWELYSEPQIIAYYANYGDGKGEHVIRYAQAMIRKEKSEFRYS